MHSIKYSEIIYSTLNIILDMYTQLANLSPALSSKLGELQAKLHSEYSLQTKCFQVIGIFEHILKNTA